MVLSFATEETALSSFQKSGSTEFKPELLGSGEEIGSFNLSVPWFPPCDIGSYMDPTSP